jgi:hypothetical protein
MAAPSPLQLGEHRLHAASCSVRTTLWIEHYLAELYLPQHGGPAALADPAARSYAMPIGRCNLTT